MAATEVEPLWRPSPARAAAADLARFMVAVRQQWGVEATSYADLYAWSIAEPERFWQSVWSFCGVVAETQGSTVLADRDRMPGARFFPEARLNYAENLLQRRDDSDAASPQTSTSPRRSM